MAPRVCEGAKIAAVDARWRWLSAVGLALVVASGAGWYGPSVAFEIGYAYEHGNFHGFHIGPGAQPEAAARWLGAAAWAGHARAQYRLGILHAHGQGVTRDTAQAARWFERAAANGYAPAAFHLGWMYHKGDGVEQDLARGNLLLSQAAIQGMAAAPLALARFYEQGDGLPRRSVTALKWYEVALRFAHEHPERYDNDQQLAAIMTKRDALAARMTPSDISAARQQAAAWIAKPTPQIAAVGAD